MNNIKLSICCITYNHEKFIEQALQGFVMQKTNFNFEVLIHDDASTDRTPDIIKEYQKKYPDIIKPVFQSENQFSKGIYVDKAFNWSRIQGEYVALCEGDDYWTDEKKLQKQVDFLDKHPDYTVCFHPCRVVWEDKSKPDSIYPTPADRFNKTTLSRDDLLKLNFIQTNSVVYRWQLKGKEDTFPEGILPCDYFIHLLNASGKIGFLPDVMSVYRKHSGGIWMGVGVSDEWFIKCAIKHIAFFKAEEDLFKCNKQPEKDYLAQRCVPIFLIHKEFKKLEELATLFPNEYIKALGVAPKEDVNSTSIDSNKVDVSLKKNIFKLSFILFLKKEAINLYHNKKIIFIMAIIIFILIYGYNILKLVLK